MDSEDFEAQMFVNPKTCIDFYLKKASDLNFEILKKIERMTLSGEFQNLICICINNNYCISLEGGLIDTMITILRKFLVYKNIDIEIINIVISIISNIIEEYEEIPGEIPSNKLKISQYAIKRLFSIGGIKTLNEVMCDNIHNIGNIEYMRCILYYSRYLEYMKQLNDIHNIYDVSNEFNRNKILIATILKKYNDINEQFSSKIAKYIVNMINLS